MKTCFRITVQLAVFQTALAFIVVTAQTVEAASWVTNSPMNGTRRDHTATLLPNGKLLVVGGSTVAPGLSGPISTTAVLFDPANGKWTMTGSPSVARVYHTATLLRNGKVLLAGGSSTAPSSAELYDPATGAWTPAGTMSFARWNSTATLLPNGKVLVAGGSTFNKGILSSAELYDPETGLWTTTGSLATARDSHSATLLGNGLVLAAGGFGSSILSSAELYNPVTGTWTTTNSFTTARARHTATLLPNGKLLLVGGLQGGSSSELYDPTTGMWQATGGLTGPRESHRATLLPNGRLLVTGGWSNAGGYLASTELYNPDTGAWTASVPMVAARWLHTATLLANGRVLVAGGSSDNALSSSEAYDSANGTWTSTGAMNSPRRSHSATLLSDGTVLAAGGIGPFDTLLSSAELYEPLTALWTNTGPMNTARRSHTATLLPNGKVLAVGGMGIYDTSTYLSSAELYDPSSKTWTTTGPLNFARGYHTATLLNNGKVLVTGGTVYQGGFSYLSKTELYDPALGQWTKTGDLKIGRASHATALLGNGKVLAVGGYNYGGNLFGPLSSAELYDPASGIWQTTGSLITGPRESPAIIRLASGKVLLAGGNSGTSGSLSSTELYDPLLGTWAQSGSMLTARYWHSLSMLQDNDIIVVGSGGNGSETYNPTTGTWSSLPSLNAVRNLHTSTLLPDGRILIVGGYQSGELSSAELYNAGSGYSNSWRPQITSTTAPISLGNSLMIAGTQFRGISGASGGNTQDSSSDYPLVQLRSIESGQTTFLLTTNWSTNSFTSLPVWNFPPGWALATVFVNGIPSTSSIININVPIPTPPTITASEKTSGIFQFSFTNSVGAGFGALASTNTSLPLSNWTALGGVTEISPGQFQFTDLQATNSPQRFYRVRAN